MAKLLKRSTVAPPAKPLKKKLAKKLVLPKGVPKSAVPKYGRFKEMVLVPVKTKPDLPTAFSVNTKMVPPDTYFAVSRDRIVVESLMSQLPGGVCIAWSSCGTCHRHGTMCQCEGGLTVERSIEYLYDKACAMQAKEEWNYTHPNYKGSFTRAIRERNLARLEARRRADRPVIRPGTLPMPTGRPKPLRRQKDVPPPARKPLKKVDGVSASKVTTKAGGIDMGALTAHTTESNVELTKTLRKELSTTTTKKKKLLRRK